MTTPPRLHRFAQRMNRFQSIGVLVLFLFLLTSPDSPGSPAPQTAVFGEFVGTTPCDDRSREFLGGLDPKAPCHCVTWTLTLMVDQKTQQPASYTLVATYG